MIILHHAGGSSGFSMFGEAAIDWPKLRHNVIQLLKARGDEGAATTLSKIPFRPQDAQNDFGDDFLVLHAEVPIDLYERLRKAKEGGRTTVFREIVEVANEVGDGYFRFVVATLAQEVAPPERTSGLRTSEIIRLVNGYIGVEGGYLVGFSYRTHREFYEELDLDINPEVLDGTTRERFITILKKADANTQAVILKGILERCPPGSDLRRTEEAAAEIRVWIARLRGSVLIYSPRITSDIVVQTLADAGELVKTRGVVSAVDRIHTALHGYLRHVAQKEDLKIPKDATLVQLFKVLQNEHPAFADLGPREGDVATVLRSLTAVLDALNPIRNRGSRAHPNEVVLGSAEAQLV